MYLTENGPEQVLSLYGTTEGIDDYLLRRTRANYSGSVTQCDRWLGHLLEAMRALGRLDDTLLIVAADHGHLLGDTNYLGKRGYPSRPEVFELPLLVRLPDGERGGHVESRFVQHVDISASVLDAAGLSCDDVDGRPLFAADREHVTVGWGSSPTVIDDRWWMNCKADGSGVFLYDLTADDPFAVNVADDHPDQVDVLFATALADAGGAFPEWILELAAAAQDAPGCSLMAARR
jgi:arylsulfatase A-like enzyme